MRDIGKVDSPPCSIASNSELKLSCALSGLCPARFSSFGKKPSGKSLTLLAKKQNTSWLTKCATLFRRAAALQPQRDGGEFVGGFLGDAGAGFLWPQPLGIMEHRPENFALFRQRQIVEFDLVLLGTVLVQAVRMMKRSVSQTT